MGHIIFTINLIKCHYKHSTRLFREMNLEVNLFSLEAETSKKR